MTSLSSVVRKKRTFLTFLTLTIPLLFIISLSSLNQAKAIQAQPAGSTSTASVYLPLVFNPVVYLPPEFVTTITLPGALCPSEVGVNPTTGIAYVANHDSGNVSLLKDGAYIGSVATGEWPTLVSSSPVDNKSFVTNLHGGVSYFKGTQLVATILGAPETPGAYGEPYAAAYNPVNGYTYIANIGGGGVVQVVNGTQQVANIPLLDGWILDVKVDPITGLVYVSNVEHGFLFVIQGTTVINKFQIGWGPDKLALDEHNGYLYAAHTSPNSQYPENISVIDLDTYQVTPITTGSSSRRVAVDKVQGLAYVTNPGQNTVSVLRGTSLLGNFPTGSAPWGVAVNEASGYAFVTNKDSDSMTVLLRGQVVGTLPTGNIPLSVATDPVSRYVYVTNENSSEYCNDVQQCFKTCLTPATVSVYHIPIKGE
jgi:DNA-binding beta-propeller fold protein YncE